VEEIEQPPHLIIVSGVSGAGKSTALKALEDMGYHCIDNLPATLMHEFARHIEAEPQSYARIALGMDVRAPGLKLEEIPTWLDGLRDAGVRTQLLFLNADDNILLRRYGETRRRHPLAQEKGVLQASIEKERRLLEPLRQVADWELDTSGTNIHQLTHQTWRCVGPKTEQMTVVMQSFGFSKGTPRDVDFMFDARCLPNPHWNDALRPLSGRDPEVAAWLEQERPVKRFGDDIYHFLERSLPDFEAAHRSFITIGIGCTGGRHRSVYLVERLAPQLRERFPEVMVHHRDLGE
jgi:UPF0042 nucleotide-binding protein